MDKKEEKKEQEGNQVKNPLISDESYCSACGCMCNCRETGACKTPEGCPDCGCKDRQS